MNSARARTAAAAGLLVGSRLSGRLFEQLPPDLRPEDEAAGYRIQAAVHALLPEGGHGPRVGWKIGCTTPVMQEYLGIGSPCAGGVFNANVSTGAALFEIEVGRRLGVECELAVRLADDITSGGAEPTLQQVAESIGACMIAIEVVEDRYVDYPAIDTATLIADDFFQRAVVLGHPHEMEAAALSAVSASMVIDGTTVGDGVGSDILGNPLEALRWLAEFSEGIGTPLRRGEVVLLGSLVQTQWVNASQLVRCASTELGSVEARFTAEDFS